MKKTTLLIISSVLIAVMYLTKVSFDETCLNDRIGELTCSSKLQWTWLFELTVAGCLYFIIYWILLKNSEKKGKVNIRSRPKLQKTKKSFIKPPVSSKKIHNNDPKVKSQVDSVIDSTKYTIDDNLPPVIENKSGGNRIYKKDFKGLQEYLKEMPNMDRIFNELTYSIRNGLTVKSYLKDANIMEDPEISNAALKGFFDIQEFLEGMYSINKNDELNKDISACKEAIQILQNIIPKKKSDDMDFDEEYLKIDQMLMSIDSYKKEYPFLKDFREKLKAGDIFLEDMDSYIKNQYGDLDGSEIMYTISLFEQIEHILAIHLNEWEENNDNVYKGFVDIEQYHSLSQKTIISLREMLTNQIFDLGKPEKTSDSKTRINWDDTEDIGIVTHYKGEPFTGICFHLYDSGKLRDECDVKDGLKHGLYKLYYESGQLNMEANYIEDKQNGYSKFYHENGKLFSEGNIINDLKEGIWKKYYENGKLEAEGKMKNGEPEEGWKIYDPNGKLVTEKNEKPTSSVNSNLEKKKLEDLIVHVNKTIIEISPEAIKISKIFHQKLIDGEINDEIHLNSMIDDYCKSISENELEDSLMDYYKIATFLNGLLSQWGKDGDFKKLNPKGYEELVSVNSFINEIGKKLNELSNDLEKTNINLNQSEKIIFDEFSTSEKEMVYHIALIRAMGEVMMVDGIMDPDELSVMSHFTDKSENEKNLNISQDNLDITKLKEYKFIWGDPVDLENRENLIISIKNMEESDMTNFFEKLLLMAFSDNDFDPKEQKYIRDLYSSCKEVSKQKSTSWINSKIKEMGLA